MYTHETNILDLAFDTCQRCKTGKIRSSGQEQKT